MSLQYGLNEPNYITAYFGKAIFKERHVGAIIM